MSALNSIPKDALIAMVAAATALTPKVGVLAAMAARGIDRVAPTAKARMILWVNFGFGAAGVDMSS